MLRAEAANPLRPRPWDAEEWGRHSLGEAIPITNAVTHDTMQKLCESRAVEWERRPHKRERERDKERTKQEKSSSSDLQATIPPLQSSRVGTAVFVNVSAAITCLAFNDHAAAPHSESVASQSTNNAAQIEMSHCTTPAVVKEEDVDEPDTGRRKRRRITTRKSEPPRSSLREADPGGVSLLVVGIAPTHTPFMTSGVQHRGRGFLQLWLVDENRDTEARFCGLFGHEGLVCRSLCWIPRSATSTSFGIICGVFADGVARIYDVPKSVADHQAQPTMWDWDHLYEFSYDPRSILCVDAHSWTESDGVVSRVHLLFGCNDGSCITQCLTVGTGACVSQSVHTSSTDARVATEAVCSVAWMSCGGPRPRYFVVGTAEGRMIVWDGAYPGGGAKAEVEMPRSPIPRVKWDKHNNPSIIYGCHAVAILWQLPTNETCQVWMHVPKCLSRTACVRWRHRTAVPRRLSRPWLGTPRKVDTFKERSFTERKREGVTLALRFADVPTPDSPNDTKDRIRAKRDAIHSAAMSQAHVPNDDKLRSVVSEITRHHFADLESLVSGGLCLQSSGTRVPIRVPIRVPM
eukprot:Polyplicarium_translucidae@DN2888_c0_g1_i4.p1